MNRNYKIKKHHKNCENLFTQKHRLVYEIHEETVLVFVLSSYGHYEDK